MTLEMRRIRRTAKPRYGNPPTWMKKEIFDGLWDIWDASKFKDRQTSNRRNRLSDRDGLGVVKSSGGTISIPHHARRMVSDVNFIEYFSNSFLEHYVSQGH